MASLFTHAFVGLALGQTTGHEWRREWRFWVAAIGCSILPDIDSIGFHLGVPYDDLWGHRGMTHSLLFAFLLATFAAMVLDGRFHSQWKLVMVFFLITASHGVLDAMTDGGLGVAFFSPFHPQRYFLPWRPIHVSPIGVSRFFSPRGWQILSSEIVWVWCPTLVVWALVHFVRKWFSASPPEANPLSNSQP
jgi:inner membrane protein